MITKDEASDLKMLIEMLVQRSIEQYRAERCKQEADAKLSDFIWKL